MRGADGIWTLGPRAALVADESALTLRVDLTPSWTFGVEQNVRLTACPLPQDFSTVAKVPDGRR